MKKVVYIIFLLIIFQSCINQKINQSNVFNPVKEFELDSNFVFNRHYISTSDSTRIELWYITESGPQFNLIYLSGNGSNIRSAIPFFNSLGNQFDLNIFSFNYSGYGLSTGQPTIDGIVSDANIAIDYFQSNLINKEIPTYVVGYSLGGYVALNILEKEIIDKGIILSTFSSLNELEKYLTQEALPVIVRPFLKLDIDKTIYKLDNTTLVKSIDKPILFIHGEKDDFIPASMSYQLYNLSSSSDKAIKIIDNADHRQILKDPECNMKVIIEIEKFITL